MCQGREHHDCGYRTWSIVQRPSDQWYRAGKRCYDLQWWWKLQTQIILRINPAISNNRLVYMAQYPNVRDIYAASTGWHWIWSLEASVMMNIWFEYYVRVEPTRLWVWGTVTGFSRRVGTSMILKLDMVWLTVRISSLALRASSHCRIGLWRSSIQRDLWYETGL
jgi:hypothetical protein